MNRREFLRKAFGAATVAAMPASAVTAFVSGSTDTIDHDGIRIDYENKTVNISPEAKGYITPLDLHRYLRKQWEMEEKLKEIRFSIANQGSGG